jgi:hypothetical protein
MEFAELNFDPKLTNGDRSAHEIVNKSKTLFCNDSPLVICAGDSFSHGHGTADYTLVGYPGDLTTRENVLLDTNTRVSTLFKFKNSNESREQHLTLWELERRLSWPGQLQILRPELQVLNLSIPGGSVERAARVLVEWSLTVKNLAPNKKITVILGNSYHHRHELLSCQGYAMANPGQRSAELSNSEKILHDLIMLHWGEKENNHYYFKEISWVYGIAKLNNFTPLMVTFGSEEQIEVDDTYTRYTDMLTGFWPGIMMVADGEYGPTVKTHSYDGHFTPMVYKNVAKKISCLI